MEDQLLLEISDSIATLTVNRPKVMNALSVDVLKALRKNITELSDNDQVRVIIITGAGEPLNGRLMLYDGLAGTSRVVKIAADPACPICGSARAQGQASQPA